MRSEDYDSILYEIRVQNVHKDPSNQQNRMCCLAREISVKSVYGYPSSLFLIRMVDDTCRFFVKVDFSCLPRVGMESSRE